MNEDLVRKFLESALQAKPGTPEFDYLIEQRSAYCTAYGTGLAVMAGILLLVIITVGVLAFKASEHDHKSDAAAGGTVFCMIMTLIMLIASGTSVAWFIEASSPLGLMLSK